MVNFKELFKDIVDVDNVRGFCFGVKDDITTDDLIFAGGGKKFSALCGFKFKSKVNPQYANYNFKLVFCTKIRSKIYRKDPENPSKWFAFLQMGPEHVEVLDKNLCKLAFDFDPVLFFDTSYFKNTARKFQETVQKGLASAKIMVNKMELPNADNYLNQNYSYLPRYITAIEDSVDLISTGRMNDLHFTLTMNFKDPNNTADRANNFNYQKFADFLSREKNQDHSAKAKKYADWLDKKEAEKKK